MGKKNEISAKNEFENVAKVHETVIRVLPALPEMF